MGITRRGGGDINVGVAGGAGPNHGATLGDKGIDVLPYNFLDPKGVAVAPDGSVYVGEQNNHRIQKFTADGVFVTKWGTNGSGDGQFQNPGGVTVASDGSVYVADVNNHRIQKFTVAP